jgi:hypothetical protein
MTALSDRVAKAKQIKRYFKIGTIDRKGAYSIWTNTNGQENNYEVTVKSNPKKVNIPFGDSNLPCFVFNVECKKITSHCNCKGNERHTVCYHGFFALVQSLKEAGMKIDFYEDIFGAVNGLNFGGNLVKVQSAQGKGIVWARVYRAKKIENAVDLLRGTREENEGID